VQYSDDESGLCNGSDELSDDESHIMTNNGNSADNDRADDDSADDDEDDDSFGEETGAPSDAGKASPLLQATQRRRQEMGFAGC
jgi:U3 small nucleolar RNA-associated protein 14